MVANRKIRRLRKTMAMTVSCMLQPDSSKTYASFIGSFGRNHLLIKSLSMTLVFKKH